MPLRLLVRLHRTGLVAMSCLGIAYALINSAAYPALAGTTRAAQHAFGTQVAALAQQIAWLLPLPLHPETAAGYLQWRGYGFFAIVFAAWGLLAACGASRRDEEHGLVEVWLAAGLSRTRLLLTRIAGFAACSAFAVAVMGLAGWIGCIVAGSPIPATGVLGESLALWMLTLACYGIALLVAQQASAFRSAAGVGAVVLLVMFLMDSLRRSSSMRSPLTDSSVFYLYNQNNAVAPGGSFDAASVVILLAVAVGAMALAVLAFNRRDIGAGLIRRRAAVHPPSHAASTNPLLRLPVLRGVWIHRVGFLVWTVGCAAFAAFVVSLVTVSFDFFTKTPSLAGYLRGLSGDLHIVLLGLIWFAFAETLLAILSITHASRWAAEDSSGVLEMELAEPRSHWSVVLERAAELAVTLAVVAFVSSAVILAVAPSQGITVPVGMLMVATALLIPFGLTFGAAGALLAGWHPRLATGILSTVAVVSYLLYQLAPAFHWPAWAGDLSVFALYGTPLNAPVFTGGLVAMLSIVVVGFLAAGLLLQRRDVAR